MNDYYIEKMMKFRFQTEKELCAELRLLKSAPMSKHRLVGLRKKNIKKIVSFGHQLRNMAGTIMNYKWSYKQIFSGDIR